MDKYCYKDLVSIYDDIWYMMRSIYGLSQFRFACNYQTITLESIIAIEMTQGHWLVTDWSLIGHWLVTDWSHHGLQLVTTLYVLTLSWLNSKDIARCTSGCWSLWPLHSSSWRDSRWPESGQTHNQWSPSCTSCLFEPECPLSLLLDIIQEPNVKTIIDSSVSHWLTHLRTVRFAC